MASLPRRTVRSASRRRAFTLIELLVVIAIIAILTAILLPVFATVRENSRQSVSISNMKDIQQKMEQFKLDNHRYPDVLFGYYYPGTTMKNALGTVQADHQNDLNTNVTNQVTLAEHNPANYFPGLYPAYIKDVEEFTDPNNTVNTSDINKITPGLTVNLVAPCNQTNDEILSSGTTTPSASSACSAINPGIVVQTTRFFYDADAYDSSPITTGTNQVAATTVAPIVRYQIAREQTACARPLTNPNTPAGCDPSIDPTVANSDYTYQLRWQNPPAGTLLMATTYHVQNADKVLVMFESGAVKKVTGHDFAALEGTAAAPAFWKVNSTWPANLKP